MQEVALEIVGDLRLQVLAPLGPLLKELVQSLDVDEQVVGRALRRQSYDLNEEGLFNVEYADVLDLAACGKVYMKLSGLNHFATDAPLYTRALPFTRRVAAAFGPRRMIWGSGTPGIVDAHLTAYSEEERAWVKGKNLVELLGLDE